MSYTHDAEREAARIEWNEALASGDSARIDAAKDKLLAQIHTRIMNEDANYRVAGWS
jgi:hypothetical protein